MKDIIHTVMWAVLQVPACLVQFIKVRRCKGQESYKMKWKNKQP